MSVFCAYKFQHDGWHLQEFPIHLYFKMHTRKLFMDAVVIDFIYLCGIHTYWYLFTFIYLGLDCILPWFGTPGVIDSVSTNTLRRLI